MSHSSDIFDYSEASETNVGNQTGGGAEHSSDFTSDDSYHINQTGYVQVNQTNQTGGNQDNMFGSPKYLDRILINKKELYDFEQKLIAQNRVIKSRRHLKKMFIKR